MYLSRMTLNPMFDQQQLAKTLCQDSYREHQALWQLFDTDPDASRDFLYRSVNENGRIKYYILSERAPVDHSGMWIIDPPKPYSPQISEGQRLFFTLRANPVVTVTTEAGKKQRHDVVMHEKKRIGFTDLPKNKRPPLQVIIQSSCNEWLQKRAATNGFDLVSGQLAVDAYQRHESFAKNQKKSVNFSSVDFQGVLSVREPEQFKKALFNGIGKSKAFGCGLLLVRRA